MEWGKMAVVTLQELATLLPRYARLAGLDVGSKTIGLALSDLTRTVATPSETVRRTKFTRDAEQVKHLVRENEVAGLIIGLPISMDGTEGPRCQSIRDFTRNLLEVVDLPTAFWDERLSTAAVQRVLIREADMTRKRRAEVVDQAAAAYILQGALDAMTASAARPS
jgi:putative Holliday junction resolvase